MLVVHIKRDIRFNILEKGFRRPSSKNVHETKFLLRKITRQKYLLSLMNFHSAFFHFLLNFPLIDQTMGAAGIQSLEG